MVLLPKRKRTGFDDLCNNIHIDMTDQARNGYYLKCSKSLSNVLRHCRNKTLFTEGGSMNISDLFNQMQ